MEKGHKNDSGVPPGPEFAISAENAFVIFNFLRRKSSLLFNKRFLRVCVKRSNYALQVWLILFKKCLFLCGRNEFFEGAGWTNTFLIEFALFSLAGLMELEMRRSAFSERLVFISQFKVQTLFNYASWRAIDRNSENFASFRRLSQELVPICVWKAAHYSFHYVISCLIKFKLNYYINSPISDIASLIYSQLTFIAWTTD